jgi:ornithine cyclodeaminase
VAFTQQSGVRSITVAGRNPERVAHMAAATGARAVTSIEEAVRAADIVCLCTHASEPVIERKWLPRGVHVCSVGYNPSGTGEVDLDTIRDSLVVVESRESALAPPPSGAPELTAAIAAGVLDPADVREIGELGDSVGMQSFTLYKSVGVGVQDAAAAALVLRAATESGVGSRFEL